MKYKVVVIDDEKPARDLIKSFLEDFEDITVVGECSNGFEGFKTIQEVQPDLIFLDVQMPKLSGFEMLELLDDYPAVIFSTAYDEFAIKAFDLSAVDYLLKPYSQDRFNQAVIKAIERIKDKDKTAKILDKLSNVRTEASPFIDRVVVKSGLKINVIPVGNIEYLQADDDYVTIYTQSDRYLKQQTMKNFEAQLDPSQFIRVHRSYIVKVDQIVQIEPYEKDSKVVVLKNGKKIKVSKTGLKTLKQTLGL
jgi:two-component system LytT family response regulator